MGGEARTQSSREKVELRVNIVVDKTRLHKCGGEFY